MAEAGIPKNILTTLPLARLHPEQMERMTPELLHPSHALAVDLHSARNAVFGFEGRQILVVHITDTDVDSYIMSAKDNRIVFGGRDARNWEDYNSSPYIKLENAYETARQNELPVAVTTSGRVNGPRLTGGAQDLIKDLKSTVGGANLSKFFGENYFTGLTQNTVAGTLASAYDLSRGQDPRVIYIGLGNEVTSAVYRDGEIFAVRGHIEVDPSLNPFEQTQPCGVNGRSYVCLDRVATADSLLGLYNAQPEQQGKRSINYEEFAHRFRKGERLAIDHVDFSAITVSHIAVAAGQATGAFSPGRVRFPTIALDGELASLPGYAERVEQIVQNAVEGKVRVLAPVPSAGRHLEGAAILGILNDSQHAA